MKAFLRQTATLALMALALAHADKALARTGSGSVRVAWSTSFWERGRPRPHVAQKSVVNTFVLAHRAGEGARGPSKRSLLSERRRPGDPGPPAVQVRTDPNARPLPAPARWRGLIGEYGLDNGILYILEK